MAALPKVQMVRGTRICSAHFFVQFRQKLDHGSPHSAAPPCIADTRPCALVIHVCNRAGGSHSGQLVEIFADEKVRGNFSLFANLRGDWLETHCSSKRSNKLVFFLLTCSPDVTFCGYSMPHPSEQRINVRLQTKPGATAVEAFRDGCSTLVKITDIISEAFEDAIKRGPEQPPSSSSSASAASSSSSAAAASSEGGGGRRSRRSSTAEAPAASAEGESAGAGAEASAGEKKGKGSKGKR